MATHSCSCLENPRDGGAWWYAIYGVAQSRRRLKQLSSRESEVVSHCSFDLCVSLMARGVEHLFMGLLQSVCLPWDFSFGLFVL